MLINIHKKVETNIAIVIHALLIILQSTYYLRKVKVKNKILIMLRRRILSDIQLAKDILEIFLLVDVIVIFEHRDGQGLAKTARPYIEEIQHFCVQRYNFLIK